MIKIERLEKSYKKNKILNNINLEIEKNSIIGLVGHNGAGKTSLMNILCGLKKQTSGKVFIDGIEVCEKNLYRIRNIVGYMPQYTGCYENFTVYECLDYFAMLSNVGKKIRKKRIDDIISYIALEKHKNKKFKNLSGGMQRRLGLGIALINNPKVLIIDEPTTGVDPNERIKMRNLIVDLSENKTVLLSTHIIEDISYTTENVALIKNGTIEFVGKINQMIEKIRGAIWEYRIPIGGDFKKISKEFNVLGAQNFENYKKVKIYSKIKPFESSVMKEPTLEDAFVILNMGEEK